MLCSGNVLNHRLSWYSQSRDVHSSVCLSVCHTVVFIKMNKANVMISSLMENLKTSVFADDIFIPKFERGSPQARVLNETGVGTNWLFSTFKPQFWRSLIGSCTHTSDWYQNQQSWLTLKIILNYHYALCYITHMFLEPTTKI